MTHHHVSSFQLDCLALGALDAAAARRVELHLDECAVCRVEHRTAAELRAEFALRVLPRGVPGARGHRPRRGLGDRARWPRLVVPALAAAVAAVVAIWVLRPRGAWLGAPGGEPELAELAIKGSAGWQVFANRDDQVFAVHDGVRLAPGDRIRFAVNPAGARYLMIASVDGAGAVTIYYPYGGALSAAIAGDRIEPAGSIVLDDAPGPERMFAILSDAPVPAALVAAELRAVARSGSDAIRAMRLLPLAVRAQTSLVFEKSLAGKVVP